jgi:tetratricopeptide (TPR) repeat protein
VVRCACDPSPDGSGGDTVVDHIRLFPRKPNVRWTYRVHEQILPALRRANVPVRWTDLTVRHTGYVDQALRARKLERDQKILQAELTESPSDPFILFNLGAIAIEQKDWAGALGYLQRSLAGSAPSDSITRKLYALIARAYQMMGNTHEAIRTCTDGLTIDPEDAELWFRKGIVHRHQGEPSKAEACWRRILELRRPEKFASVDMGIYGHLTCRNLAALAAERGDHEEQTRLWTKVLAECPGDREAVAALKRLKRHVVAWA